MNETGNTLVSAILLAAGKSERMGQNKLLMPFGGGAIIGRTLDNLLASRAGEVIVVLGSRAAEMRAAIGGREVVQVLNPNFARGMSTSLQAGLGMINRQARCVMVALADQPLVTTRTYDHIIEAALEAARRIVVPTYRNRRGNPIAFPAGYVQEILGFSGDVGGRQLLQNHPGDVLEVAVDDPGILANINTLDEYTRYVGAG